jgi:ribose 5-phosphate isomerase B
MALSEDEVKAIVRRVVLRTLGQASKGSSPSPQQEGETPDGATRDKAAASRAAAGSARPTVTEADVLAAPRGGRLLVAADALVTPLARQAAAERRVQLELVPGATLAAGPSPVILSEAKNLSLSEAKNPSAATGRLVALGADHGGLAMKEDLKAYVGELGYQVVDCGTNSSDAVDYPDFAYAVARLVAEGRAWRGIVVDGAGIGSCMAANKVPGVRAAMCYDHATAVNSREHNDANVLTLGGLLLGRSLARDIVRTWLATDFGGGRHARRVDKIMAIEKRFKRSE